MPTVNLREPSSLEVSEAPNHTESSSTRVSPRLTIAKLVPWAPSHSITLGRLAPSHSITEQK